MILSKAYDVEVTPNFFSVTIVDLNHYLETFSDVCSISIKNGKEKRTPIPLVQKYTVAEIKKKLESIRKCKFYITDSDDSQLLPLLGELNTMRSHYNEKGVPVRTDMFGYNSNKYDDLMIAALLMYAGQTNTTAELITKLYETSKSIIDLQNNPELAKQNYLLNTLRKFALPFIGIDVMSIFALNKVGVMVNADGEKSYYGKSLKQTSINLQWYELLEYNIPPISEEDAKYYNKGLYAGLPPDRLNKLINKWDRYILPKWIPSMMHYNENDVFIVCEMIRLFIDEVRLRYSISKSYGVNVLSSSRSNIADKLFVKFYSEFSGLDPTQWRGKTTERTALAFKRVIFPFIKFKTKPLQELLEEMKQIVIYSIGKKALKEVACKYPDFKYLKTSTDSGWFEVKINKLVYTIATGGLHSQDIPRELKSKLIYNNVTSTGEGIKDQSVWDKITDDSYIYIHWDISDEVPHYQSL